MRRYDCGVLFGAVGSSALPARGLLAGALDAGHLPTSPHISRLGCGISPHISPSLRRRTDPSASEYRSQCDPSPSPVYSDSKAARAARRPGTLACCPTSRAPRAPPSRRRAAHSTASSTRCGEICAEIGARSGARWAERLGERLRPRDWARGGRGPPSDPSLALTFSEPCCRLRGECALPLRRAAKVVDADGWELGLGGVGEGGDMGV